MIELNKIYNEDCLEGMKRIPDGSVDMILCDLPYGTTACKWDTIIPFEPLWGQYKRIIKDDGAIVLFGSEPFSSKLRMSNLKLYKYDWIWNKTTFANQMCAKFQPLKIQENISVFSKKKHIYHPQGLIEINKITKQGSKITDNNGGGVRKTEYFQQYTNYPRNILEFKLDKQKLHSTQKPVALFEYLIKTYTNENETVLDNCMGSGTTAVAAINTNRKFIGFELDKHYCDIANERIQKTLAEKGL